MEPILDSPVKEGIRQKNEAEASRLAGQVVPKAGKSLKIISALTWMFSIPAGIVMALVSPALLGTTDSVDVVFGGLAVGFVTFVVCRVLGVILIRIVTNKEESDKNSQIRKIYRDAEKKTRQEIKAYEDEVEQYCQKALQKAENLTSMTDHVTDMLERRISHADAGPNRKFLEASLFYTVERTGIVFSYASNYSNPVDDYNFDRERFRNLNSNAECEGLAQALARLVVQKIKKIYPPNSIAELTISHVDAAVTLHFKAVNKNFQTSKDIF